MVRRGLIVITAILLTGCSEHTSPANQAIGGPAAGENISGYIHQDPYSNYKNVEDRHPDWVELSREDALVRAMLGCRQPFSSGTQDAALQAFYGERCEVLDNE